jgi:organic radical activating enzyme
MKTYTINEVFYSLQGEGVRAGTANVFVRFTGCNLRCSLKEGPKSPGGFDCDTEFTSGRKLTVRELHELILEFSPTCKWLILTGGEPGLQVDKELIDYFHEARYQLAIETNGTVELPTGLDWITLSPKVAEHCVKQLHASELKYVRGYGQAVPVPAAKADHYLVSPAFDGGNLDKKTLEWCIKLCKENPTWRLSVQQHKQWAVR